MGDPLDMHAMSYHDPQRVTATECREFAEAMDYMTLELRAAMQEALNPIIESIKTMTNFNAKAIQSVPRADIIARSVIGDKTLALLSRAPGLNLLRFEDFERRTSGVVNLDADLAVRDVLTQGYGVDRIETMPDGTARAHVSKVIGLNYPEPNTVGLRAARKARNMVINNGDCRIQQRQQ